MILHLLLLKWQSDRAPDKMLKKIFGTNLTPHTPAHRRLKSQITSTKFQTNLKYQYPMTKTF